MVRFGSVARKKQSIFASNFTVPNYAYQYWSQAKL